uniref:Uncharacterized protein n=1 Tax=Aplanochytrium stocchinoi TaxID=215587 RepID=A0A7S3V2L6_9STRA|mmetsp:Transcript_16628/g.18808  ORF Transcript_16628/g.18808 Transcript_16628/m.18808 type:complete len:187 (+) Transcript_16628:166-726(+)
MSTENDERVKSSAIKAEESCFWRNNPWTKVDGCYSETLALQYKRAMNLGLLTAVLCFFGLVIKGICGFYNVPGLFHIIPAVKPYFGSGLNVLLWFIIVFLTVMMSVISLFIGLSQECTAAALIVNGIVLLMQAVLTYILMQIDPDLKDKLMDCWHTAGCSLKERKGDMNKANVTKTNNDFDVDSEI